MKRLIFIAMILSANAQAEIILSAVTKYGPNGYAASGSSSSTTTSSSSASGHGNNAVSSSSSSTVSNNSLQVSNRIQANLGLRLELLSNSSPFVIGLGAFQDSTIEGSIGIRLGR